MYPKIIFKSFFWSSFSSIFLLIVISSICKSQIAQDFDQLHSHHSQDHSHHQHHGLYDLHQHQHHHHHYHHQHHYEQGESPQFKYSKEANQKFQKVTENMNTKSDGSDRFYVFLNAFSSTFLISIAPFIILFFIPLENTRQHQPFLKVLLSFASGGLLGDAFLHLIPHALLAQQAIKARKNTGSENVHSHGHGHGYSYGSSCMHSHEHLDHDISIGLWVLIGILVFLIIEKFIRIMKGISGHGHSHDLNIDSSFLEDQLSESEAKEEDREDTNQNKDEEKEKGNKNSSEKEDTHLVKRVRFAEKTKIILEPSIKQFESG